MIAYWCGFNGFSQISVENSSSVLSSQFKLVPLNDLKDIDFAWSCAVLLSAGDAYVSGFCGNKSTFLKKLTKPDTELEFLKVACHETYALFTSEDGECWQYFYNTEEWKKLVNFTVVEEGPDVSSNKCLKLLEHNEKSHVQCNCNKDKRKIIQICCGEIVNIALDNCGQAYSIPSPTPMPGIKIVEVACGFEHCLLLDDFGRVYSSGSGMRGQLGCEMLETVNSPQEIDALGGLHVKHIAAGGWHSAAITLSGILYTWGWNNSGQLGFPTIESFQPLSSSDSAEGQKELLTETSSVSSSPECNLLPTGQEETLHYDTKDSTKSVVKGNESESTNVPKNKRMKVTASMELDATIHYSENEMQDEKSNKMCKEREDTPMEQKEHVTVLAVPRPVDFPTRTDIDVVDVSCGNRHTIVLAGDGTVWGCGWNAYGQLGKLPDTLISVDSMIKLDISVEEKICGVHCGGWNTVVFCNK